MRQRGSVDVGGSFVSIVRQKRGVLSWLCHIELVACYRSRRRRF